MPASHTVATAGGYQNNCGLYSIAHSWLSLPEHKIRELAKTHSIYSIIFKNFYDFYHLPGTPNIETIIQLNNIFNHPLDREMLWGSVLRQTLRDPHLRHLVPTAELKNLSNNQMIFHDTLALLAQSMGATLTIHNQSHRAYERKHMPATITYHPPHDAGWKIELFYQSNHYNFSYPCLSQNRQHNLSRNHSQAAVLYDELFGQKQKYSYTHQENQQFIKDMIQAFHNSLMDQGPRHRYQP